MYNKIFSKIIDSSIWLEPTPTRIVWVMFIALMDQDGFVQFASVANVAHRARITESEAAEAIKILESSDENSGDPEHEGKRIEKVPGGWMVLNSEKYKNLVTREEQRRMTRERVARHREAKRNAHVTPCNDAVTQSEAETDTEKKIPSAHAEFVRLWSEAYKRHLGVPYAFQSGKDGRSVKSLLAATKENPPALIAIALAAWKHGGFYSKSASSITGFYSKFNEIRQEIKTGATNSKHHSSGTGRFIPAPARPGQYEGIGKIDPV